MTEAFQGSCLCGAVIYEIRTKPKTLLHCHCSQCRKSRKSHGAAFATYGRALRDDLHIIRGADSITAYPSSDNVLRQFCARCGSSLFWARTSGEYSDWISIALGTLDTPYTAEKQKHVEVSSKAPWHDIQDDWPQCR